MKIPGSYAIGIGAVVVSAVAGGWWAMSSASLDPTALCKAGNTIQVVAKLIKEGMLPELTDDRTQPVPVEFARQSSRVTCRINYTVSPQNAVWYSRLMGYVSDTGGAPKRRMDSYGRQLIMAGKATIIYTVQQLPDNKLDIEIFDPRD